MNELKGKTAFITGGANGIGLGMAEVFGEQGMNVVIADIRGDHLERATRDLSRDGRSVHPIQLDVRDRAAMAAAADETEKVFGRVHLVCNNAGINLFKPMDECTYNDWDWVMGVNLGGVINGVVEFVARLKAHGEGGHIVNTASMASIISGPGAGIYTAAKFGVRGLSECLHYSLAPFGIGVSVLCPGLVRSMIYDSNSVRPADLPGEVSEQEQAFLQQLPLEFEPPSSYPSPMPGGDKTFDIVIYGGTSAAVAAAVQALECATQTFAERRMDRGIRTALAGRHVDQLR